MTLRPAIALGTLAALFVVQSAVAGTPDDGAEDAALHARLLGPLPGEDLVSVPRTAYPVGRSDGSAAEDPVLASPGEAGSLGLPTSWIVGLGALALGLAAIRRPLMAAVQQSSGELEPPMTVVARERLGGMGSSGGLLTLLDVQDSSGETRRLLVGSGADGPQLVADLSIGTAAFATALDSSLDAAVAEEEA